MRKDTVRTAITASAGIKNHGIVPTRSYMPKGCARIAILMSTT
jgi:hypothetical protein